MRDQADKLEAALADRDFTAAVIAERAVSGAIEHARVVVGLVRDGASRLGLLEDRLIPLLARAPHVGEHAFRERFHRGGDAPHPVWDQAESAWHHDDADGAGDGHGGADHGASPMTTVQLTGVSRGTPSPSTAPSGAPTELGLARMATTGGGSPLPFAARIQASFGRHDVSSLRAHEGDEARRGASALGARAFALGDDIAFARTPDLHTAAHEAAHAIQQRHGLAAGDDLERHADRVAAAVVAGRSAERILDHAVAGRGTSTTVAVQRKDEVGTLYGNDVAVEMDHGSEVVALLIPLTPEQQQRFAANPDLANALARDVAYMFTRRGQPRPESKAFLESKQISDMIARDLDSWLRGRVFPSTSTFLDQRQAALDGLRLIAPLERWLAQQGIAAGSVDWKVVIPRLLAMPAKDPKDMFEASAEDRYRTVLQGIANEASSRLGVTGATTKAETLAPLVRAWAGTLGEFDLGNTVTTHSEAFLKKWAPEIAGLPYVPSGFDIERLKPTTTKDTLEIWRSRMIAEFKRTRMPNLIVQYVRDNWSASRQTADNYLRSVDMRQLEKYVVGHMTKDFMELAKTNPDYRRALASAAHDQARYDSLKQIAIIAHRIETNHRNLPQRLLKSPSDLDAGDAAIAANPYAYLETARSLSMLTTTIFSTMQRGGDMRAALATIPNTEVNRMFGAVTALMALGTAIKDLRQTHADQEEETRKDLDAAIYLQLPEVTRIVQTMWDDAEKWINEIYIPKLKQVAIRILTQNRDELAHWDKNWATETPKVIATYKVAAFALRDIAKKLQSGEATSVSIQGQTLTVKDLEQLEHAAKTMEGIAGSLSSKDGAADKRKELKEAIAAFDRTKEKINNGDHPPWAWGKEVATVARAELGIGEFPEYSTFRDVFTGRVQASKNPFIARAIAGWQFREKLEAEFKQIAIMVGLGLLSVASVLAPGVGALILGAIDIGLNIWHAKVGLDQARAALDLALLDPHLKLQGLTVEQARKALHSAKIAMVLSIVIPLGVAALAGLLIWRLGAKAKQLGSGFAHFDAAFKKDPTRVSDLLKVVGDMGKLDKLLELTKDAKLLDELLLHAGTAANVEKFLAKIPDATKLIGYLTKVGDTRRLGMLLEHIKDAGQLDKLLGLYKGNYAKLEQHLAKLAAYGEKATSGARLDNLITKVGSLEKLEPLLATGADIGKIEKLLDTIKAERLTGLLKSTKNVENLEKLLKHVTDIDHLERLLSAAKDPGKLLNLLEHANPASVENILKHVKDADHAADLLKHYGKNVAQLEKHLAALGTDAAAGARLSKLLGKVGNVAKLEDLLLRTENLAQLEELLKHLPKLEDLEKLLATMHGRDLAQLATRAGGMDKLLEMSKVAGGMDKLLEMAKGVGGMEKLLDVAKQAGGFEKIADLVKEAGGVDKLMVLAKEVNGLDKLVAMVREVKSLANLKTFLHEMREIKNAAIELEKLIAEFKTPEQLKRLFDLSRDAAHSGKITLKTIQEGRIGLDLEAKGILKGPITRYPGEAAEFYDAAKQAWDVKGFFSATRPGQKGAFKLVDDIKKIGEELKLGENVIVDTVKMNAADIAALRAEVTRMGWDARVRWYP